MKKVDVVDVEWTRVGRKILSNINHLPFGRDLGVFFTTE